MHFIFLRTLKNKSNNKLFVNSKHRLLNDFLTFEYLNFEYHQHKLVNLFFENYTLLGSGGSIHGFEFFYYKFADLRAFHLSKKHWNVPKESDKDNA